MAVLPDAERREAWAEYMRETLALSGLTKAELRAAVDAVDDWVNANAASFNAALPQPARSALTAGQKARLLAAVAVRRYNSGV